MIELNKVYFKKSNRVECRPFKIEDGYVHYSHVGYFDHRARTISDFLETYELKTEDNEKI